MLKIALIGNCQVSILAACFKRSRALKVVAVADINVRGQDSFNRAVAAIKAKDGIDFVVSQSLSDDFGDISSSFLSSLYGEKFLKFTNLYFHGLHPDLTYYGALGRRVQSPLGDYHSKLAITGFVKGKTVTQCLALYGDETYEKMGYYSVYPNSAAELLKRDDANEIKFARQFLDITQENLTLLSVNHPTSSIIAALANTISAHLCGDGERLVDDFFVNNLSGSTIWPVYPELAARLKLRYGTPMLFYPHVEEGRCPLTLEEFVTESYRLYSEVGLSFMLEVPLGKVLQDLNQI